MMKKMIVSKESCETVDLSTEEQLDRTKEEVANDSLKMVSYIKKLKEVEASVFVYKKMTMKLTEKSRAEIANAYSVVSANPSILDDQIMMRWVEKDQEDILITAGDLRKDGSEILLHRQKCITVGNILAVAHKKTPYSSVKQIDKSFKTEYDKL